ncbi:glycoside hydrolase domain-containing protein [Actinocorallia aurantiaca]|uniref:Rv2525c-like glycoside hydrolase-like domain-containing protein n=1 Tax=Actinocorallia aurantiaca TaxID=46204 RepID=A0ABN3U0S1_9ACTN
MPRAVLALGLLSLAIVLTGAAAGAAPGDPAARAVSPPRGQHQAWASGHGFDTCAAPSLSAMRAWRKAYSVTNIYIGGAARSCDQPHLTSEWVREVRRIGYRLIPTYVGPQAPCTRFRHRFTAAGAFERGADEAVRAVLRAQRLGIPEGQPIYYDMEAYKSRDRSCRDAVLAFLDSWTTTLYELGYLSGVYSSAGSGIRDLAEAEGIARPHAIWYARWNGDPDPYGDERYVPADLWYEHQRIKQYRGGHFEEHGGVRMKVDSNFVDGPAY